MSIEGVDIPPPPARRPEPPTALDDYAALKLDPNSEAGQELLQSVGDEQDSEGRLVLSDDFSVDPAGFTPNMMSWWKNHVAQSRGRALAELNARFQADPILNKGAGRGCLVEAARAKLDHERVSHRQRTIAAFWRRAENLVTERDQTRSEYELMAAGHGRKPVKWRPTLYFLGLLVILTMEGFLNFETFLGAPFIPSPVLALGATLLVAAGIAAASHLHGEVLKQWDYHFGPHDRTRQWQGSRKIALGGTLLTAALILVAGSRYYIILGEQEIARALGEAIPSMAGSMTVMLMGNLIVYGVGVVWSFFQHDADPEYPKALDAMEKAQQAFDRLYRAEMIGELDRGDARHAVDCAALGRLGEAQKQGRNYAANRDAFARFCAVDSAAEGTLRKYRAMLVKTIRTRGDEPAFEQETVDKEDGSRSRSLSAEQFLSEPIVLKML